MQRQGLFTKAGIKYELFLIVTLFLLFNGTQFECNLSMCEIFEINYISVINFNSNRLFMFNIQKILCCFIRYFVSSFVRLNFVSDLQNMI
jgi:hypothetical protein